MSWRFLQKSSGRGWRHASPKVGRHGWSRARPKGDRKDGAGDRSQPRADRIGHGTSHSIVTKRWNFWCLPKNCRPVHRFHPLDQWACRLEAVFGRGEAGLADEGSLEPESHGHRSRYILGASFLSRNESKRRGFPDRLDRTDLRPPKHHSG